MTTCEICGALPCINPSFCKACRDADRRKARGWSDSPHLAFLRRMMEPEISLERAWDEINRRARERYKEAPEATVNAVVYELRAYGLPQLSKPNCRRRLSDLSAAQVKNLMASLHQSRGQYPNVTDGLLTALGKIFNTKKDAPNANEP